ncbi:MAG: GTP 3',8-cyclase MoaA [Deltaproteobacteria bacterium]|nr:GTP 3',8-cyclase MoaA [Deltaproteobacteria bacterium]
MVDTHGRTIDYLRVSITDLCNFRCVYCRPPEGVQLVTHKEILRYEEILAVVEVALEIGIRKVRITGGEPLVRRGVVDFIARLTRLPGLDDVALTTNGVLLTEMAHDLKVAGLKRINISLDSARRDVFTRITGQDKLDRVLAGIDAALTEGFDPVKINVVLLQGINEEDVPDFARMTLEKPLDVRFIERMPFGEAAPADTPLPFSAHKVFSLIGREVGKLIPVDSGPLDGPASLFQLRGARGRIGIVDPVTGHFCGACNRLRLTARGTLRPCLLAPGEIDIKAALRNGATREELSSIIHSAVRAKPDHGAKGAGLAREPMSRIGG